MKFIVIIAILASWLFGDFTRDIWLETVYDSETGFTWQDNEAVSAYTSSWTRYYCEDLDFADKQDWRLPSIDELETLSDTQYELPAISPIFQNVGSHVYWSSTRASIGSGYFQTVGFSYGSSYYYYHTEKGHMICVHSNTPPVITNDSDSLRHEQTEGTKFVLDINATDIDNDTLTYSVSGGLDSNRFTIDGITGYLSFISTPVYSSPTDSNQDNIYEVEVSVDDGHTGTDSVSILVRVNENTNIPPSEAINTGSFLDGSGSDIVSSVELSFDDDNSDDTSIIYTITMTPINGMLKLNNTALENHNTFTQEDINNNFLVYTYDINNIKSDSFKFDVMDEDGGETTNQSFNFTSSENLTPVIMYLLN